MSRVKILSKAIKLCLIGLSVSYLTMALASCVTTPRQPSQIILGSNNEPNLLDIKFIKVVLPRMKMWNALSLLSDTINHVPEKIARFSWGIRILPDNIKGIPEETNPWVSINLKT